MPWYLRGDLKRLMQWWSARTEKAELPDLGVMWYDDNVRCYKVSYMDGTVHKIPDTGGLETYRIS